MSGILSVNYSFEQGLPLNLELDLLSLSLPNTTLEL